jgi:hypothetical protein
MYPGFWHGVADRLEIRSYVMRGYIEPGQPVTVPAIVVMSGGDPLPPTEATHDAARVTK